MLAQGRGNLIVEYPGTTADCISVVGCHLDVVSANPEAWDFDPFTMKREGDKLYGRGTTDCLGHAAILTSIMAELGRRRPVLNKTFVAVFIANEENSKSWALNVYWLANLVITAAISSQHLGIGVDELVKRGLLDHLKTGPLFWMDTADSQPCIGTGLDSTAVAPFLLAQRDCQPHSNTSMQMRTQEE
eukprot:scaffold225803_cov38-Prasinocladus_malaysianus.AAC.1